MLSWRESPLAFNFLTSLCLPVKQLLSSFVWWEAQLYQKSTWEWERCDCIQLGAIAEPSGPLFPNLQSGLQEQCLSSRSRGQQQLKTARLVAEASHLLAEWQKQQHHIGSKDAGPRSEGGSSVSFCFCSIMTVKLHSECVFISRLARHYRLFFIPGMHEEIQPRSNQTSQDVFHYSFSHNSGRYTCFYNCGHPRNKFMPVW